MHRHREEYSCTCLLHGLVISARLVHLHSALAEVWLEDFSLKARAPAGALELHASSKPPPSDFFHYKIGLRTCFRTTTEPPRHHDRRSGTAHQPQCLQPSSSQHRQRSLEVPSVTRRRRPRRRSSWSGTRSHPSGANMRSRDAPACRRSSSSLLAERTHLTRAMRRTGTTLLASRTVRTRWLEPWTCPAPLCSPVRARAWTVAGGAHTVCKDSDDVEGECPEIGGTPSPTGVRACVCLPWRLLALAEALPGQARLHRAPAFTVALPHGVAQVLLRPPHTPARLPSSSTMWTVRP